MSSNDYGYRDITLSFVNECNVHCCEMFLLQKTLSNMKEKNFIQKWKFKIFMLQVSGLSNLDTMTIAAYVSNLYGTKAARKNWT